jgi:hypothetical protein
MALKKVLFFSRNYQSKFFPLLNSDNFESIHVTLTKKEKQNVQEKGGKVVACLEEDYEQLELINIVLPYLKFSWGADRFIRNHSYTERLIIQKKMISFWSNILDKYSPDVVINEPVVIEISEILWIESKKRNIKYLSMAYFNKPNKFYWFPYPEKCTLRGYIENLQITNQNVIDAKMYISDIYNGLKPAYIQNLQSRHSLTKLFNISKGIALELFSKIKTPNKTIRQICYGDNLTFFLWQFKLYSKSLTKSMVYDDMSKISENIDYLFFPLHYEPEGVLFYGAYFFDNQNELIKNILQCIGENRILIVKEHPQQPGMLLQSNYISLKKRYPNLMFCKAEESSIKIINQSKLLLTLGGTSGFEALVLGKTVVNFGSVFYDAFEGVINIHSFDELYKLLRENKDFPMKGDLVLYTAKLFSILKDGDPHPHKNLFSKENVCKVTLAIEDQL